MSTWSPSRALTLPDVPATRPSRSISRPAVTISARSDTRDGVLVGRLEHARLGDDGRDQLGGRDVEGEVHGGHPGAELGRVALLDRDGVAIRRFRVDRGD